MEELETLGCSMAAYSCSEAPEWVFATSYWSGAAYDSNNARALNTDAVLYGYIYSYNTRDGVRPVITVLTS